MHPNLNVTLQQRVLDHTRQVDALNFFHLLTGPKLREQVEELLPIHRERVFPPTETLAMFLGQALSRMGAAAKQSTMRSSSSCCREAYPRAPIPALTVRLGRGCPCPAIDADVRSRWHRRRRSPVKWHWQGRPVRSVTGQP